MWIAAAALALASPGSPAPEEGSAVVLQWEAPAACPDVTALRRELQRYVSADAQVERPLRVRALVREDAGRFALDLELDAEGGLMRQRIVADRCEVLASATALVVAVLLDPAGVVERVEPSPPPEEPPSPPPVNPPISVVAPSVPTPAATPAPKRRRAVQAILRIAALGGTGVLPRFGAGFSGAVGIRGRLFRAELVATGMLPQRTRAEVANAGARVDAWTIGPRGCVVPAVRTVEFPVCTGLDAGQIRARGFGLQTALRPVAPWVAIPLSASVLWAPAAASRRFAFGPGNEAWVATTRPRFGIDDLGPLYRAARAGVRAWVTVELRLP
jgi:hypothetical protein